MRRKWFFGFIAAAAVTAIAGGAIAAPGQGDGKGGEGRQRLPVVFGTLTAVSGSSWTVKPEVPPRMKEKLEQRGHELPQLPASVTVSVDGATKYFFEGAAGKASDFAAGDPVVIKLDKPRKDGCSLAQVVADPATARDFIMEKLKQRRAAGGENGERAKGEGRGRGKGKRGEGERGEGERRGEREGKAGMRPHFGVVTAISATSVTITPEIPDFVAARITKLGLPAPELPASITLTLDGETKYFRNGEESTAASFSTGDRVAVMGGGKHPARAVSDYASAEKRMEQRQQRREERREKRGKQRGDSTD